MLKDLTPDQQELAIFMSDISEKCYYADWLSNLEYVLWEAVNSGERKYGHGFISQSDIDTLKTLAIKTNSWIIYDDDTRETALDLITWTTKFQADCNSDPTLIED